MTWTTVCRTDSLVPDRGVAAIVDGKQIAIFLLSDGSIFAVDHCDPNGGAPVIARGLIGSSGGIRYVASPLLKERYDLASGLAVDADHSAFSLSTYAARVNDGTVQIQA